MKSHWFSVVAEFTRKERHPATKKDFPSLIFLVWKQYNNESGKGGFRHTGIHPFNEDIVPVASFRHSELFTCTSPSSGSQPESQSPSTPPTQISTADNTCNQSSHLPNIMTPLSCESTSTTTLSLVELLNEKTDNNYSPPMPNIPETDSMNQTTPTTPITATQHQTPPSSNSDSQLRNIFVALLTHSRPSKNGSATKKRLTGIRESLTSEEAMK